MYLYHFVPDNQYGKVIYPLNELKHKLPDVYRKQSAKYANLKEKDVKIPGFGYWNDCVNLMPVNPILVKRELEEFGHTTNWSWEFYLIDTSSLVQSNLIIMISDDGVDASKRTFIPFSKENFEKYCHIGEPTRYRYKIAKEMGEQPNTFAGIPHVLYKGSIDTSNLEIVKF